MRWRYLLRDGTDSPEEVADFVGCCHENRVWNRFISQRIEHDQVHTDCPSHQVVFYFFFGKKKKMMESWGAKMKMESSNL